MVAAVLRVRARLWAGVYAGLFGPGGTPAEEDVEVVRSGGPSAAVMPPKTDEMDEMEEYEDYSPPF